MDCSMVGMEPQCRATNVWIGSFDRLVARWRFALGARLALGAAQVHGFHRPVLVLDPRSGSARAVREQLLEAAGRYGIQLDEAETRAGLVGLARQAVADGAAVLLQPTQASLWLRGGSGSRPPR
jgi:hypothetical protein